MLSSYSSFLWSYLPCTVDRPLRLAIHTLYKSEENCVLKDKEVQITQTYLNIMRTLSTDKGDLRLLKIWRLTGTSGKMVELIL